MTLTPHRMNSDDPGAQHVSTVSMKLPPFWCSDPQLWFAQVEAQFLLRGISAQRTKFDHVVAALAPDVATEVRDIILNPPASDPYDELRKQLIQRTSQSERRRLQQLLNNHDFGDLTPTRLLRKLQQLRGQDTDDPLFRELFLQRLPTSIRVVLASFDDALSLDELAIRAERMTEADSVVSRSAVSEVTSSPETSECEVNRLRADIVDLRKRLIRSRPVKYKFAREVKTRHLTFVGTISASVKRLASANPRVHRRETSGPDADGGACLWPIT